MPADGDVQLTTPAVKAAPETDQKLEVAVQNRATVEALYKGLLGQGHMDKVAMLIASDLEYWFHGPPGRQHMMRILTGETVPNKAGFRFEPRSVTAIGDCVITEGWEGQAYWVHVWTLKNGLITKFREYFNTWLVVRDLTAAPAAAPWVEEDQRQAEKMTLWQSQPRDLYRRSLPGLLLAI
ncbi:senescence associated gene 20-like [Prosopis cineraria]|uniref:senescence associated gene 20-like n=1 Tax=Prosopis cineraria TaxID=364024 RepID=UPI00240F4EFF|nr:senescence associated gene 20-like [Prosopis cineraria]